MKDYKVILYLMIDPTKGDATTKKTFKVKAENKNKALEEAEKQRDEITDIKYLSLFDYKIEEIE